MSERAEHSGRDWRGNSSDLERQPENTGAQGRGKNEEEEENQDGRK